MTVRFEGKAAVQAKKARRWFWFCWSIERSIGPRIAVYSPTEAVAKECILRVQRRFPEWENPEEFTLVRPDGVTVEFQWPVKRGAKGAPRKFIVLDPPKGDGDATLES